MPSTRAISRRIKRHVLSQQHDFFAVCTPGLEEATREELETLVPYCSSIQVIRGGVLFQGPTDVMYLANLHLSTASRVLLRLDSFPAPASQALFARTRKIKWELFVQAGESVRFRITSRKSRLNHKRKIQSILQAALNDRLREQGIHEIVTHSDSAKLEFHVRLDKDSCTFSFNTSGENLHKRGWRRLTAPAPLRETLAAFVLKVANSRQCDLIVDPFCGSGTLLIEAARVLSGRPPGEGRSFAFEASPIYEARKWRYLRSRAMYAEGTSCNSKLLGSDVDPAAVAIAEKNARMAGLAPMISFDNLDALSLPLAKLGRGANAPLLVSNLPYGKRLADTTVIGEFAQKVNAECGGWRVALLCADAQVLDGIRFANRSVRHFVNGGLEVALVHGEVTQ